MSREKLAAVFAEWEKRYREDPGSFMSMVEHLLGETPYSYGQACAVYFETLAAELFEVEPDPMSEGWAEGEAGE